MIKAVLIHNPYLLETQVLFNGKAPRINSLVEKYQEGTLQNWVKKIPSIFYDEMNGYNFELEFTGTGLDFQELQSSFADAGVTDDMVHLFHKNELDERDVKQEKIDALLEWLNDHPNRKFDNEAFRFDNKDLFEGTYSFIVFQNHPLDASALNGPDVEVEYVSEYKEVETTDLRNTPILIFISEENRSQFQTILGQLLDRPDVIADQIFFMTHSRVDGEKAQRVVMDLGIENPQFITDFSAPVIQKYLDLYPRSEYIAQAISVFRMYTDKIASVLEEENRKSEIANRDIHKQIDELDSTISWLKESLGRFVNRDNIDLPENWIQAQQLLLTSIKNWKIRKTKVVGTDEAIKIAGEFDSDLKMMYHNYLGTLNSLVLKLKDAIVAQYCEWYRKAEYDDNFINTIYPVSFSIPNVDPAPSFIEDFLKLKEERYVQPKEDLFGHFFKASSPEPKEPVLEITYFYQNWRECAADKLMPLAEGIIQGYYTILQNYETRIADMFVEHLEQLISEKTEEKEVVSLNLSEDEQKLQNDNDWLAAFCDQLTDIERG